jgi:hypothetical protein
MAETTIKVPTRQQGTRQYWLRGIVGLVALLGVSTAAGVVPLMGNGIPHRIGSWMQLTVTTSARSVLVHAMLADGYEVLPAVNLAEEI